MNVRLPQKLETKGITCKCKTAQSAFTQIHATLRCRIDLATGILANLMPQVEKLYEDAEKELYEEDADGEQLEPTDDKIEEHFKKGGERLSKIHGNELEDVIKQVAIQASSSVVTVLVCRYTN